MVGFETKICAVPLPSLYRIGTFHGHTGAVRGCDITFDSKRLLTAGADNNCILWEMDTGKEIFRFTHPAPVLGCALAEGVPNPYPDRFTYP